MWDELVAIKFYPQTANKPPKFGQEFSQRSASLRGRRSQQTLDEKYCRYERKLLKGIWEHKQFESSTPIPESSIIIRNIPASELNAIWFLVAPIAAKIIIIFIDEFIFWKYLNHR
jgi:hypothetical protein